MSAPHVYQPDMSPRKALLAIKAAVENPSLDAYRALEAIGNILREAGMPCVYPDKPGPDGAK